MNEETIAVPKKGLASSDPLERAVNLKLNPHRRPRYRGSNIYSLVNRLTGAESRTRAEVINKIKEGLSSKSIKQLEVELDATQAEMSFYLSIPISTLRRRIRKEEKLAVDESDRVVRLARIKDLAVAMMGGDDEAAKRWLHTPRDILNNETPLEHASTEIGAREVEELIGRIRHGVFS